MFGESRKGSSWAQQFILLAWRSVRDSLRNTEVILAKFGISALLGVLVGAMYSNVGDGQQSIYDRKGVLFFVTINQAFGLITTVCGTFPKERKIVLRERACNSYHISAYYLAKVNAHVMAES
jgi:ATP-binding cassette subfamily G (WHITE) protein 2